MINKGKKSTQGSIGKLNFFFMANKEAHIFFIANEKFTH
jgi:hypothetical protein